MWCDRGEYFIGHNRSLDNIKIDYPHYIVLLQKGSFDFYLVVVSKFSRREVR